MATKVTFLGSERVIQVNSGVTEIDVTTEIYSDWKEWVLGLDPLDSGSDNSKYLPALRTTGGDPLTGGESLGRYYFLINDWKIRTHPSQTGELILVGNLFTEDATNILTASVPIVRQNFSALTFIESVSGSGGGLTTTQDTKLSAIYTSQSLFDVIIFSQSLVSTSGSALTPTQDTKLSAIYTSQSLFDVVITSQSLMVQSGTLSPEQQTMLLEIYRLMGLDPTRPLVVTPDNREAGTEVSQSIVQTGVSGSTVTVTRI